MKKQILFISTLDLTLKINGGIVYTKSLLNLLKDDFDVDFLPFRKNDYTKLDKLVFQIIAILKSLLNIYPSKVNYFKSEKFKKQVLRAVAVKKYDYIIFDHCEMTWLYDYIDRYNYIPVLLAHNIEYELYSSYVSKLRLPLLKKILIADAKKYKKYELRKMGKIKNVISISQADINKLSDLVKDISALYLPITFNSDIVNRTPFLDTINIGFLGSIDWWPNKEGILWFINEVFEKCQLDNIVLNIYGHNNSKLSYSGHKNINCYDFIEDISEVWKSNHIFIQPIFSGSGMNIKLAEALYHSKHVIATPFAIKGLIYENEPSIIVKLSAEDWISAFQYDRLKELIAKSPTGEFTKFFSASAQKSNLTKYLNGLEN